MNISRNKIFLILVAIILVATIVPVSAVLLLANNINNDSEAVKISLVKANYGSDMSCIMIEANGKRLYIDAYNLRDEWAEYPADAIFITHPHGDHYHPSAIDLIAQDSTEFVGPSSCTDFIDQYDATGVVPGDTGTVAGFQYEAIPAYSSSHPREENWCGYVITVNGVRILHCGDSANNPEYEALAGSIDVACLPVGMACSNMGPEGATDVIGTLNPTYVIPYHHDYQDLTDFKEEVEETYPDTQVYLNDGYATTNPLITIL
jgi:L-ascorbate metabolism protein UlaG (beta-lactamase superfamily)